MYREKQWIYSDSPVSIASLAYIVTEADFVSRRPQGMKPS